MIIFFRNLLSNISKIIINYLCGILLKKLDNVYLYWYNIINGTMFVRKYIYERVIFMKRIISVFLVALLTLALLCACNNTTQPDISKDNNVSTGDVSTENSGSSSSSGYVSGLPSDLDFGGDEFIIYSGYSFDITASTMVYFGGDDSQEFESNVVNDASVERINVVEEMLNVDIIEDLQKDSNAGGGPNSSYYNAVLNAHNSGTSSFHMTQGSLYNMGYLTQAGCLTDLMTLKYLDNLKGEWWSQKFKDDVSIKDSVYYAVGDISFGHINCIYLLYYNKNVQANNDVPDLYEMVDNNTWTYDAMFQITKDLKKDLDDDATYTYADQYGLVGQTSIMWAISYATDATITKKDADGLPSLNINSQTSIPKIQKALEYLTQDGNYLMVDGNHATVDQGFATFYEDRTLFMPDHTGNIAHVIGQMTGDFGFLPHPKYDENQENYYSLVSPWGGLGIAVPYTLETTEEDFVSAVMEEMAVQGKNILTGAYIEKLCKLQKTVDERSKDMLDIIFTNSGCELGMIHKIGGFPSTLQTMLSSGDTAVSSKFEGLVATAEGDIEKLIAAIESMK